MDQRVSYEDNLLLVHNKEFDCYYTVGGKVKFGESTEEAILREVLEETQCKLYVVGGVCVLPLFRNGKNITTNITTGEIKKNAENGHFLNKKGDTENFVEQGVLDRF